MLLTAPCLMPPLATHCRQGQIEQLESFQSHSAYVSRVQKYAFNSWIGEIGTIGWYSKRKIIDILGLVTADIAKFVAEGDFNSWVNLYTPDYILVHDPLLLYETGIEQLAQADSGSLLEVIEFQFPGYKLYSYSAF